MARFVLRGLAGVPGERAELYHCAPAPPGFLPAWLFRPEYLSGRISGRWGGGFFPPESGRANVQSNNYWSGTEYAPNTNNAWNFNTNNGNQNANNKNNNMFAWAVRPG